MRVVQLGPYPPPHGGVQTHLVAIREHLRNCGIRCAVINITRYRRAETDDVYYPKSPLGLLWHLFRRHYDVVHLHIGGMIPLRVAALALVCTVVPGTTAILTLHSGGYPSSDQGRAVRRKSLLGFALRRFNFLIGVNEEIVSFYLRLGVAPSRTRLIPPHSVAGAKIAERLPDRLASFFAEHDPVLVAVCGLEPEYDLPRQIEALGLVLKRFPRAGLAIIGSGSLEAGLRQRIESTAYARSIVLCGDVPHDATLRAITNADVLLRTTLYDGDAISIREALYLGTPVVATDNGMRPSGVHLIPIGNTQALVNAVEAVIACGAEQECHRERDARNIAQVLELYREATDAKFRSSAA